MTSIWVAEHGWYYLNAIIDCCTREIVAWQLELRCRADEAIAVVERAAAVPRDRAGRAHARHRTTARPSPPAASARGSPSSGSATAAAATATPSRQAFIESWFGKLKEREVWLNEYETLDDARRGDRRLRRPLPPPPALAGSTTGRPTRSRQTWEDRHDYKNRGLNLSTPAGSTSHGSGLLPNEKAKHPYLRVVHGSRRADSDHGPLHYEDMQALTNTGIRLY